MSIRTSKIKTLWNQAIHDYDHHMEETGHYGAQKALLDKLLNHFQSPVLDLAAGPGFLSEKLLEKEFAVSLNDFSEEMHELFSRKFSNELLAEFSNQDAMTMKFDKKFKTVLCCNLLYYLDNKEYAINHWKNLLQEGGSIILFEEYPFLKPSTDLMKPHENELMDLIEPISPDDIIKLFTNNGFSLQKQGLVPIDNNHDLYGFVFNIYP